MVSSVTPSKNQAEKDGRVLSGFVDEEVTGNCLQQGPSLIA